MGAALFSLPDWPSARKKGNHESYNLHRGPSSDRHRHPVLLRAPLRKSFSDLSLCGELRPAFRCWSHFLCCPKQGRSRSAEPRDSSRVLPVQSSASHAYETDLRAYLTIVELLSPLARVALSTTQVPTRLSFLQTADHGQGRATPKVDTAPPFRKMTARSC